MVSTIKSKAVVLALAVAGSVGLLTQLEGAPPSGKPYVDVAGVLTDCYGNTKNVRVGFVRSKAECTALLNGEAKRIGTFILADLPDVTTSELTALISFTYNVGDYAYRASTLRKEFKAGRTYAGCTQMYRWNKITVRGRKVPSNGLTNRRIAEVQMCLRKEAP